MLDQRSIDEAREWPDDLSKQTELQLSMHFHYRHTRHHVIMALHDDSRLSNWRRARRMAECGTSSRLFVNPEAHQVKTWMHRCNTRLCPYCSRERSARVAGQLERLILSMAQPRIMVLTIRSTGTPLPEQLAALRQAFARLRKSRHWREHVSGGAYTLEITQHNKTHLWHPHLHIVYDGNYYPHGQLKEDWREATGDSDIVWLERLDSAAKAAKELAKYIGKPQNATDWTRADLATYAEAIHGTRMVQSFGKTKVQILNDNLPKQPIPEGRWQISIARLVFIAEQGQEAAAVAAHAVAARYPMWRQYILDHVAPILPPTSEARRLADRLMQIDKFGLRQPPPKDPPPSTDVLDAQLWTALADFHSLDDVGFFGDLDESNRQEAAAMFAEA